MDHEAETASAPADTLHIEEVGGRYFVEYSTEGEDEGLGVEYVAFRREVNAGPFQSIYAVQRDGICDAIKVLLALRDRLDKEAAEGDKK
jgi:hypothetical protein